MAPRSAEFPPAALPRTPDARRRQLRQLLACVDEWLAAQRCDARRRKACVQAVEPALAAWLAGGGADAGGDVIGEVAAVLAAQPDLRASGFALRREDAGIAFARALLRQAGDDVESEARRAGHGDVLQALRPWLARPLPGAEGTALAAALGLGEPALQRALDRLRRRWRQRIDAGLALWSSGPAERAALRRQLHAYLVEPETLP